jgi:hypothetical protein
VFFVAMMLGGGEKRHGDAIDEEMDILPFWPALTPEE